MTTRRRDLWLIPIWIILVLAVTPLGSIIGSAVMALLSATK